ncbi:MAG: cell division protein FtsZ [Rubrivivax sp.]|nr:cell division protein FtsZ [Rubrivivax sp.]
MSLTAALALLAAAVLLALLVQGWWGTRRLLRRRPGGGLSLLGRWWPGQASRGATDAGDTIPDRQEPSLGPEGEDGAAVHLEDGLQPVTPAELATALRSPQRRELRLDALIDAIVPLALEHPIAGETALAHLPPTRRAGSKPFYVEGLEVRSGQWEPLTMGQRYAELQAGVQLVNRAGPLNEIEYSEFVHKIEAFAESVHARADAPDMLDAVARARELDGLASPLDAQLSIRLLSNGVAWSVSYLAQVAAHAGLMPGVLPGRWVLPAAEEGEPPLVVLSLDAQAALADDAQAAAVRECMLAMDVPHSPQRAEPFAALHAMVGRLANELDATPIDDLGEPITEQAFRAIGDELVKLYRSLEALDLAAGTPAARRLFS